jgi:hypothetical protein
MNKTMSNYTLWIGLGPIVHDFPLISEKLTDKSNPE